LDTPQTTHAFRTLRSLLFFSCFLTAVKQFKTPVHFFSLFSFPFLFCPFVHCRHPFVFQVKKLETKEWQFYLALA